MEQKKNWKKKKITTKVLILTVKRSCGIVVYKQTWQGKHFTHMLIEK